MRKIPTVFRRNPDDMRHLLPEVTPGCEWVLAGEGNATRKYNGTCVMLDNDGAWWARREIKPGKQTPPNFVSVGYDDNTGKTVGWEPIAQSGFAKWHTEALSTALVQALDKPGTYELCGPKINGDSDGFGVHVLIKHSDAETFAIDRYSWSSEHMAYEALQIVVGELAVRYGVEGLVWHHPDGRMAKLKARDFDA